MSEIAQSLRGNYEVCIIGPCSPDDELNFAPFRYCAFALVLKRSWYLHVPRRQDV